MWSLVTGLLGSGRGAGRRRRGSAAHRPRRTRGRGLAIAGGVLGVLGTVALRRRHGPGAHSLATRPLPADVLTASNAHAQQLVTGNCLAEVPDNGAVDSVRVVPCADPHEAQVVTEYTFAPTPCGPGQQAADARVARACVLDETEMAGGVATVTWSPTEHSWGGGDRRRPVPGGRRGAAGVTGSFLDDTAQAS